MTARTSEPGIPASAGTQPPGATPPPLELKRPQPDSPSAPAAPAAAAPAAPVAAPSAAPAARPAGNAAPTLVPAPAAPATAAAAGSPAPQAGAPSPAAKAPPPGVALSVVPPASGYKPVAAPARNPANAPAVFRGPAVPAAPAAPAPVVERFRAPAGASRLRGRHFGLLITFLAVVVFPILVSAWYLWARAADQYASFLGFSVHREDTSSAISLLTGLSSLSGSSSTDTDIIFNYINSQQLVAEIDKEIGLRTMWSKPQGDPYFTLDPEEPIEDLLDYWRSMVNVYYDSSTRLIEVRVLAFTPEDAQRIAEAIYAKSTVMINRLNDIAAADNVRFAREELEKTRDDLIQIRQEMTVFRNKYQLVDPGSEVVLQSSIIATLQQELAASYINLDVLRETSQRDDPRLAPLERRIRVIEERIKAEKAKIGGTSDEEAIAEIVAQYERMVVDREFSEAAYQAARTAYEAALAENRRQSRYLAAHILPTKAESSQYPERFMKLSVLGVLLLMVWAIGALLFYSLRDRR